MEKQVKRKRPVLICFEDRATLDKFFNSEEFKKTGASSTVLLLVEELNEVEKVSVVKRAAGVGQVTLMTRVFGRGTDFKVFDPVVEKAGGVHVLSTFVSTQLSEEVQIRGRTARQGADGTFEMVLLDVSLG
jgi:preprotein translocase subunit SecA